MFNKFLEDLGLSNKEAQVYLALLEVDSDSVLDLSKKTKINRTTIYPVLESLAKKGLISEIKIDNKIRFQAEPPERLKTFVERQKTLLEEYDRRLNDVIPQLKSVQRESGERPIVKIYEGRDGVISSLEDFYKSAPDGATSYSIYSFDLVKDVFTPSEKAKFYKIRKDVKKMSTKALYNKKEGEIPETTDDKADRIKLDEAKYPLSCDITISGDEVRISSLKKSISSILIKSKDFAETLKSVVNFVLDNKNK